MTWASSTSWCGRTTSSPPCDATDDDGGNSSLAGEMARRGSENARGVLAARAVVERRCVTRASLCRLARVSRGAPRPPRKNSPLRVCPLVSLGASRRPVGFIAPRSTRPSPFTEAGGRFVRAHRSKSAIRIADIARILWFRACRVVARNTDTDKPSIHGSFFRREGIHNLVDQ